TPSADLTSWTVVIRDGLEFSDGQSVTATRIKEGHDEFLKDGKATEGLLRDARVSGVLAPDPSTLVYELSEPNSGLPKLLAGPVGRVFSVEAARLDPAAFLRAPVGTGPFVFESWAVGENPVLTANLDYWRQAPDGTELPLVDRLEFVEVADEQERLDRLRTGEGHVLQTRAPRAVQQARELQFTVIAQTEDNIGAIVFNTLEPPFDDTRVRRGLLLAYDQQALLAASGVADVTPAATQWWSPDSIWYSQRAADAWPGTDLEESRRLLAEYQADALRTDEREVGEPISVRIQCPDDLQLSNMARALEGQWESTGVVDVEVEIVSRSGLIQRVMGAITDRPSFSGDFTVTCWRMGGESDPWALLSTAVGPVKTSPLNVANMENERLVELVALVQSSPTFAVRRAAIEQIMITFAVEAPALYLGHATTAVVGTDDVYGLGAWTLPSGDEVFGQVGGVGRYAEVGRT
ncbi:MAG: ABC transporter substrate-binding protein, partial [Actinomycetota bacterium]|nr:ABC transporter substrate-binding protein [Actinomycetota bacterium]